jgi:hypothetical protein
MNRWGRIRSDRRQFDQHGADSRRSSVKRLEVRRKSRSGFPQKSIGRKKADPKPLRRKVVRRYGQLGSAIVCVWCSKPSWHGERRTRCQTWFRS